MDDDPFACPASLVLLGESAATLLSTAGASSSATDLPSTIRNNDQVVNASRPWPFLGFAQLGDKPRPRRTPHYGTYGQGDLALVQEEYEGAFFEAELAAAERRRTKSASTKTDKKDAMVLYGGEDAAVPLDGYEHVINRRDFPTSQYGNGQSVAEVTPKMRTNILNLMSKQRSQLMQNYYHYGGLGMPELIDRRARRGIVKRATERVDVMYTDPTTDAPMFIVDLTQGHRLLSKNDNHKPPRQAYAMMHGWLGSVQQVYSRYTLRTLDGEFTFCLRDSIMDSDDPLALRNQMSMGGVPMGPLKVDVDKQVTNIDAKATERSYRHAMNDMYVGEKVRLPLRTLEDRCADRHGAAVELPDALVARLEEGLTKKMDIDISREVRRRQQDRITGQSKMLYQWSSTCCYDPSTDTVAVHLRQPMRRPSGDEEAMEKVQATVRPMPSYAQRAGDVFANRTADEKESEGEPMLECKVIDITMVGVDVQWTRQIYNVRRQYAQNGRKEKQTVTNARHIDGEDLKYVRVLHTNYGHYGEQLRANSIVRVRPSGEERVLTADEYRKHLLNTATVYERVTAVRAENKSTIDTDMQSESASTAGCASSSLLPVDVPVVCSVVRSHTKLDVLWETGEWATNVREDDVMHAHPGMYPMGDRDYYPGMFVKYARSSTMIKDVDTVTSGDLLSRVGLVIAADNRQKVCTIRWFEKPTREQAMEDQELTVVEECATPFHFITGCKRYNFMMGAMVQILGDRPTSTRMGMGVLDQKHSSGRIQVRLFDDMDKTVRMWPWHVVKLRLNNRGRNSHYHPYAGYEANIAKVPITISASTDSFGATHIQMLSDVNSPQLPADMASSLISAVQNAIGDQLAHMSSTEGASELLMLNVQQAIGNIQGAQIMLPPLPLPLSKPTGNDSQDSGSIPIDMGEDESVNDAEDGTEFAYVTDDECDQPLNSPASSDLCTSPRKSAEKTVQASSSSTADQSTSTSSTAVASTTTTEVPAGVEPEHTEDTSTVAAPEHDHEHGFCSHSDDDSASYDEYYDDEDDHSDHGDEAMGGSYDDYYDALIAPNQGEPGEEEETPDNGQDTSTVMMDVEEGDGPPCTCDCDDHQHLEEAYQEHMMESAAEEFVTSVVDEVAPPSAADVEMTAIDSSPSALAVQAMSSTQGLADARARLQLAKAELFVSSQHKQLLNLQLSSSAAVSSSAIGPIPQYDYDPTAPFDEESVTAETHALLMASMVSHKGKSTEHVNAEMRHLRTVWKLQLNQLTGRASQAPQDFDERWAWSFTLNNDLTLNDGAGGKGKNVAGKLLDLTAWQPAARRNQPTSNEHILLLKTRLFLVVFEQFDTLFGQLLRVVTHYTKEIDARCSRHELMRMVVALLSALQDLTPDLLVKSIVQSAVGDTPADGEVQRQLIALLTLTPFDDKIVKPPTTTTDKDQSYKAYLNKYAQLTGRHGLTPVVGRHLDVLLTPLQLGNASLREYNQIGTEERERLKKGAEPKTDETKRESTIKLLPAAAVHYNLYASKLAASKTVNKRVHLVEKGVNIVNECVANIAGMNEEADFTGQDETDASTPSIQRCLSVMHAICRPLQILSDSCVNSISLHAMGKSVELPTDSQMGSGYTAESCLPYVLNGLQSALSTLVAELDVEEGNVEELRQASFDFMRALVDDGAKTGDTTSAQLQRLGVHHSVAATAVMALSRQRSLLQALPAFQTRWLTMQPATPTDGTTAEDVIGQTKSVKTSAQDGQIGQLATPAQRWTNTGTACDKLRTEFGTQWRAVELYERTSALRRSMKHVSLVDKMAQLTFVLRQMSLADEEAKIDEGEATTEDKSPAERLAQLKEPLVDVRKCGTTRIAFLDLQAFNNALYDALAVVACVVGRSITQAMLNALHELPGNSQSPVSAAFTDTSTNAEQIIDDFATAALWRSEHMTFMKRSTSPTTKSSPISSTGAVGSSGTAKTADSSDKSSDEQQDSRAEAEYRATLVKMQRTEEEEHDDQPLEARLCEQSFEVLSSTPPSHKFAAVKADSAAKVPRFLRQPAPSDVSSASPAKFMRAISKELRALRSALPEGIFVKAYEDRMDLFSCMIRGPQGTPYDHCLFCFDIRLNNDYPQRPPQVFYRSLSQRLNPNLYVDGMVCLSLLGTWQGQGIETWSPTSSTLLQVFLSIQSLVLTPEPYYLEPGYETSIGQLHAKRAAREYNENAVIYAITSLQRLAAEPIAPFESEIREHVIEHTPQLIKLLDAYIAESKEYRVKSDNLPDDVADESTASLLLPELDDAMAAGGFPSLAAERRAAKVKQTGKQATHLVPSSNTSFNLLPMTHGAELTLEHHQRALAKAYERAVGAASTSSSSSAMAPSASK